MKSPSSVRILVTNNIPKLAETTIEYDDKFDIYRVIINAQIKQITSKKQ